MYDPGCQDSWISFLSDVVACLLALPSPHLVPVMTRPGSGRSPWPSWVLYTYVPRHFTSMPSVRMVVSMDTALVPLGFLAALWHWIFPHLASLMEKKIMWVSWVKQAVVFFPPETEFRLLLIYPLCEQIILSARYWLAKFSQWRRVYWASLQ